MNVIYVQYMCSGLKSEPTALLTVHLSNQSTHSLVSTEKACYNVLCVSIPDTPFVDESFREGIYSVHEPSKTIAYQALFCAKSRLGTRLAYGIHSVRMRLQDIQCYSSVITEYIF